MPEHFNKTTSEAKFWCKPCNGPTMHYVHDGRRGGCQECIRRKGAVPKQAPAALQGSLDLPAVNGFDDVLYASAQAKRRR